MAEYEFIEGPEGESKDKYAINETFLAKLPN